MATLLGAASGAATLGVASAALADTWTVLGYISGDNNLEEFAVGNVVEMQKVGTTANLAIVVQLDRSLKYSQATIPGIANFAGTKRLKVDPGGVTELQDMGDPDGTDPATIADFIQWGIKTYPAQHYALILWDHGGAWQGCNSDETGGRSLTPLPDLATGVANGLSQAGVAKVDLIGFDECLMGSIEVAHVLQPHADVLVASQETEPGEGWDYQAFLGPIVQNPSITAADVGKAIAQGFEANVKSKSKDPKYTLSVIDLSKIAALESALDTLAGAAGPIAQDSASFLQIAKPRGDADGFGRSGQDDNYGEIDLGQFLDGVTASASGASSEASAARTALNDAILFKVQGPQHQNTNGLSIYVPERTVDGAYASLDFPTSTKWGAFLTAYTTGAQSDTKPPDLPTPTDTPGGDPNAPDTIATTTTAGDVDEAGFILATDNGDGTQTFLGELPEDRPGSDGKLSATFDSQWPTLTDGSTDTLVPFFVIDSYTDGGNKYATLAVIADVAPEGNAYRPAFLLLVYDVASRQGTLVGAFEEGADGASELDLTGANTKIRPAKVTVAQTGDYKVDPGSNEYAPAAITLGPKPLPVGNYVAGFVVTDYAGNTASSLTSVKIKNNGGGADGGVGDGGGGSDAGDGGGDDGGNGAGAGSGSGSKSGCACDVVGMGDASPVVPLAAAASFAVVLRRRRSRRS